jgi:hypothetical protein
MTSETADKPTPRVVSRDYLLPNTPLQLEAPG